MCLLLCLALSLSTRVVHGFLVPPSLSAVVVSSRGTLANPSIIGSRNKNRSNDVGELHYNNNNNNNNKSRSYRTTEHARSNRRRRRSRRPESKRGSAAADATYTRETIYQPSMFEAFDPAKKDFRARDKALSNIGHERGLTATLNTWAKSDIPDAADRCYELLHFLKTEYIGHLSANAFLYTVVCKAFVMRSQPARAQAVLGEYLEDELADPPVAPLIHSVMNCWVKSRPSEATKQCRRLLNQMKMLAATTGKEEHGPTVVSYSIFINALAKQGRAREAEEQLRVMMEEGIVPNVVTFSAVVNAWAKSNDPEATVHCRHLVSEMQKLAKQEEDPSLGPNAVTYNTLLDAFSRRGQGVEAEEVLNEMIEAGFVPSQLSFGSVMAAWDKSKTADAPERCWQIMEQMVKMQKETGSKDLVPNCKTYNMILHSLARRGRVQEVEEMLQEMLRAGTIPNVITFNTVMHAWVMSGSKDAPQRCKQLLTEMEQLVERTGRKDLTPDVTSYSTVVAAYTRRGMAAEAESVLRKLEQRGMKPDLISYSTVMNAWAKSDADDGAERCYKLLLEMKRKAAENGRNNVRPDLITYVIAMQAFADRGNVREAEKVFLEMLRDQIEPRMENIMSLCRAYARFEETDAAVRCQLLLTQMKDLADKTGNEKVRPSVIHYNSVIRTFATARTAQEAESLLRHMIQQGLQPSGKTYRIVMNANAKAGPHGSPERCLQLWEEMRKAGLDDGQNVLTYNIMIHAYVNHGRQSEAENLVREMAKTDVAPDVVTFSTLLKGLAKSTVENGPEKCRQFLSEMKQLAEEGNRPEIMPTLHTYNTVLGAFGKRGRTKEAKAIFEEMKSHGVQPDTISYTWLLTAYCNSENDDAHLTCKTLLAEMKELAEEKNLKELQLDSQVYRLAIEAVARRGLPHEAEDLLKDMQDEGVEPTTSIFTTVIDSWAKSNETDAMNHCLRLLEEMKRLSAGKSGSELIPTSMTHNFVLDGFANRGQAREAEEYFTDMLADGIAPDLRHFAVVMKAWEKSGDKEASTRCKHLFLAAQKVRIEDDAYNRDSIMGYMQNLVLKLQTPPMVGKRNRES